MYTGFRAPRLSSIENCMKLTQMVVQGLQEAKSPLLQLPHFEEEHLRYCISKKVHRSPVVSCPFYSSCRQSLFSWLVFILFSPNPSFLCIIFHFLPQYKVRSLQDLVSLKDSDRRNMLRFLGEEKYDEVIAVLGSFPHITTETKLQGRERRVYFSAHIYIVCSK